MVLHHLGESTLSDVQELEKECNAAGAKSVIVAGDISNEQTAKDVSTVSHSFLSPELSPPACTNSDLFVDRLGCCIHILPTRRPNFQRRYLPIPHIPRPPHITLEEGPRRKLERGILCRPSSRQPNGQTRTEPNDKPTRIDRRY